MESILGTDGIGNTGTRAGLLTIVGSEIVNVIYDTRWMLLAILVCVIADFRYGWRESQCRYEEAKQNQDPIALVKYSWHSSRAWRRTMNKLCDYLLWVTLGAFIGMAIIQPLGYSYIYGCVTASAIAIMCEAKSFFGHFFYLHGINIEKQTLLGFIKGIAIGFAKSKSPDIGEGLEQGFMELEKQKKGKKK